MGANCTVQACKTDSDPSADVIYDGSPEGGFNMNTVMHFQRIDQLCNRGDAKYGFYHSKHTAEDK